jgi:hypothetical protein
VEWFLPKVGSCPPLLVCSAYQSYTFIRHYWKVGECVAYVRIKRVDHYEYYQLVENRWVEGKPR